MPTAVFVGLCTLDVFHALPTPLGANEKARAHWQYLATGGPAANAAVIAAALSHKTFFLTALGDHPLAEIVRADLSGHGVAIIDTIEDSGTPPPPISLIRLATDTGERSVSSLNDGALGTYVPAELPTDARDILLGADGVLFDGYFDGLARAALDVIPDSARVVLDVGSHKEIYRELAPRADIAAASAEATIPGADDPAAGLLALGAHCAVTTAGADEIRVVHSDCAETVTPPSVDAVDTLGAGDAFHGALLAALIARPDWDDVAAVDFAARVASHRTTILGPRAWLDTLTPLLGELRS
ncbi:hypothetical protein BSZ39_08335 [Bowdeniella nasicola]|uniref:Carbohydrate kinase PfkB domain-containing protein n=1 Tax=Bowdeniella nasicola TaxID=208480 RepID=A0A1Q5Q1L4_9ACTO|nr:PfkB family carbohydrate kinase [Bowdeniella nasicola]OKL53656.1 hypothetical protein BSZ39_08335 [Bowdeniella nasicola]